MSFKASLYSFIIINLLAACDNNSISINEKKHSIDSVNNSKLINPSEVNKKLSFNNLSEIINTDATSIWVEKQDSSFSLALHFMYKDTLAVSYSPECWLMFPYKLENNKLIVYWDNNIDTKYDFDIVKAVNKIDRRYIGKPFMTLELLNDTTLKANYLVKELIKKINNSSKERIFFPDKFHIVQGEEEYQL